MVKGKEKRRGKESKKVSLLMKNPDPVVLVGIPNNKELIWSDSYLH